MIKLINLCIPQNVGILDLDPKAWSKFLSLLLFFSFLPLSLDLFFGEKHDDPAMQCMDHKNKAHICLREFSSIVDGIPNWWTSVFLRNSLS